MLFFLPFHQINHSEMMKREPFMQKFEIISREIIDCDFVSFAVNIYSVFCM